MESPETEVDGNGVTRIKLKKQGWSFWTWRGHKIHYIKAGKHPSIQPYGSLSRNTHDQYLLSQKPYIIISCRQPMSQVWSLRHSLVCLSCSNLAGPQDKPPVVLVHGFGASAYHWRYIIPELAKHYCVHAVDLLGFGFSEKPSVVYDGYNIWSEQLSDYVKQASPSLSARELGCFLFDWLEKYVLFSIWADPLWDFRL